MQTKKLSGQLRQHKVAYQHEIRKYENNLSQIKAKINQLLSDKNPNKKIGKLIWMLQISIMSETFVSFNNKKIFHIKCII